MQYLLPCACGRTIPVDLGQAGQTLTCECGHKLEVPTLRGIKALPPAETKGGKANPSVNPAPAWSPLQGGLFSAGILIAIIGIAIATYSTYIISQLQVPPPSAEQLAKSEEQFDRIPLDELYNLYLQVREAGLGMTDTPLYVRARQVRKTFTRYLIAGSAIAVIGIGMTVSSFVIRPATAAARPKKPT